MLVSLPALIFVITLVSLCFKISPKPSRISPNYTQDPQTGLCFAIDGARMANVPCNQQVLNLIGKP